MTAAEHRRAAGAAVLRAELTGAITDAVLDELADTGYARLSMESVARRAGAGKSALYRRWPSKLEMVGTAVGQLSGPPSHVPDTGSLHGDLVAMLRGLVAWLTAPRTARTLPDLIAEASRTPALAAVLATAVAQPRRAHAAAVLRRALDRGELPRGTDIELALGLLAGLVYWRLLVRGAHPGPGYAEEVAAVVGRALGASPPR